jgi:transposase
MAKRGRPVAELTLTDEERETLQRWARRAKSSQALAQRCRIVLGCAAGKSNKEVAAEVGVWPQTVCKWRQRFVEDRLNGLTDEPRPGAPRTIGDEQIEQVLVATLERQPADATHWSRASMAAQSGLSKSTVGRIWKAFGLKRTWSIRSRSATIRSSSTRSATSSGCIWIRRKRRWCCA